MCQSKLLQKLHIGHSGMSRMKSITRSYLWWPGLDGDIEDLVRSHVAYQLVKHVPSVDPLRLWTCPAKPWEQIHVDFVG